MPIFEYKCQDCNHTFEKLVPRSEFPVECPACQSDKVEKQLSVFAAGASGSAGPAPSCGNAGCGSGSGFG